MDSFAKTPFFLKSPKSMASSHYGHDHGDHEFASLKTYNDENVEGDTNRKKN